MSILCFFTIQVAYSTGSTTISLLIFALSAKTFVCLIVAIIIQLLSFMHLFVFLQIYFCCPDIFRQLVLFCQFCLGHLWWSLIAMGTIATVTLLLCLRPTENSFFMSWILAWHYSRTAYHSSSHSIQWAHPPMSPLLYTVQCRYLVQSDQFIFSAACLHIAEQARWGHQRGRG